MTMIGSWLYPVKEKSDVICMAGVHGINVVKG